MEQEGNAPATQVVLTPPPGRPAATLAQVVWVILFALTTLLFLDGLSAIWNAQPVAFAEDVGISPRAYVVYHVALDTFLFLSYAIAGLMIFWRTPDKWFSLVVTLAPLMLLVRIMPSYSYPLVIQLAFEPLRDFLSFIGASLLGLAFAIFPDGRFVPRWTRFYALFVVAYAFELYYLDGRIRLQIGSPLVQILLDAALVALGVAAQAYRYRRVSTPEQRQQTRWVLFGFTIGFIGTYAYVILPILFPGLYEFSQSGIYYQVAGQFLSYLALLAVPVTFAIAILRYRLWDIDLVIRRTLVYSALTGLLALIYLITVIALQSVFGTSLFGATPFDAITGERSSVPVVLSTLFIAALFTPLRRSLQNGIDRRFYRRKYDAQQVLAAFAENARQETDPEKLTAELLRAVQETMQPTTVELWLTPVRSNDWKSSTTFSH